MNKKAIAPQTIGKVFFGIIAFIALLNVIKNTGLLILLLLAIIAVIVIFKLTKK